MEGKDKDNKQLFTLTQRRHIILGTLIFSAGMIIAGFMVEPPGVIDSSVLTAIGEITGFVSLCVGFETGFGKFGFKKDEEN